MKLLLSQLKKYLPDLTAEVRELGNVFTMIGYMEDGAAVEITYQGKKDFLYDLEVRQNRADCFGVQGLAREISAYYNIPMHYPESSFKITETTSKLDFIEVKAEKAVKRVMAVKMDNLKVSESPDWLKEYLALYDINSINNLVDLTNYVMLETSHASHAFDLDKMQNKKLVWEIDPKNYKKFVTLSGETLDLTEDTLVVSDGLTPLSLSFIGGKDVAISKESQNIILEMAVYDGGLVRRNSRAMRTITEAGSRLEKYMDPESIPEALEMLIGLIIEHCGGNVTSDVYDNFVQKEDRPIYSVDLDKVAQIAGIKISHNESKTYLQRLGFEITKDGEEKIEVARPINRLDIEQQEDVFEEVIRLKGYDKIPTDEINIQITKDVTPTHINLVAKVKNNLVENGFDEVRSWVLVNEQDNINARFQNFEEVKVTNSINDEVPSLRLSISVNLIEQLKSYIKNNIAEIWLFEEGKIFGKVDGKFIEQISLGVLINSKDIDTLRMKVENLLNSLGISSLLIENAEDNKVINIPTTAHPKSVFTISHLNNDEKEQLGILYVTNENVAPIATIAEINIDKVDQIVNKTQTQNSTQEITNRLVTLDTNITISNKENVTDVILRKLQNNQNIWNFEIVDEFKVNENESKYTVRLTYMHLSDTEAKLLHSTIFAS